MPSPITRRANSPSMTSTPKVKFIGNVIINHHVYDPIIAGEKWRRDILDQSWYIGSQKERRRSERS